MAMSPMSLAFAIAGEMNECREVNEERIGDEMGDDEVEVSSGDGTFSRWPP
jgi:hypothetical protein